jgi:8-oxo-dGTP pyrophosphatase MutT (NUDIX family)
VPGQRQSAVLILFSGGAAAHRVTPAATVPAGDISILLTERAHTMRSHPGQVSFPGGRAEPDDADLAATALREANEEVGVEPSSVAVAAVLSPLNLAVSSHDVSPVLGWWERPGRVWVRQPQEVERVLQVPVADLVDPANRFRVGHPSGWIGPAFQAEGLLVWGFTALLLDGVLRLGGWEREWDESDVRPLP